MTAFVLLAILAAAAFYWAKRPANTHPENQDSRNDWVTRAPSSSQPPELKQNSIDPDAAFEWTTSENGNESCEWNLINATVFRQDSGWKYVVNITGGKQEDAAFSNRYRTQDQAAIEAERYMENLLEQMLQRR